MNAPTQSGMVAPGFLWVAGLLLAIGYLTLGWIGAGAGIASLDAQGIMHVSNVQALTGKIEVSRPPGHPLSEFWMLPNLVRLSRLAAGDAVLSPFTYGLYQLAGGVFCLTSFWLLLGRFHLALTRRVLAMACLAFTPQFLITSSEGEEFLWGTGCVFVVLFVLSRLSAGEIKNRLAGWFLGVAFAVAASGYRIEYGGVALLAVFATLLVSDQSWPRKIGLAAFAALFLIALWWPVLAHHGMAAPYANPLSLKTRLGVGLYKIVFLAMGVAPFLIGLAILFQSRGAFRIIPPFDKNNLDYWAFWLVLIFFALFFVYPTKILVVLPGVAFLILLGSVHAGRTTWAFFVAASMSLTLIHLDVFKDRHWTGPRFQSSLWAQNLAEKPAALRPQVDAVARIAGRGRHVVISDLWPWSLAWQHDNAAWPGIPDPASIEQGSPQMYTIGPGVVASRSVIDNDQTLLARYIQNGYDVLIDKDLYRESFMRYDLSAPTPETGTIQGVQCRIIEINEK